VLAGTAARPAQSKRGFDRVYGGQQTERGKELWTYTRQNFAKIAEDIGALGIRVEKPAEIGPALPAGPEGRPARRHRRRLRHRRPRTGGGKRIIKVSPPRRNVTPECFSRGRGPTGRRAKSRLNRGARHHHLRCFKTDVGSFFRRTLIKVRETVVAHHYGVSR
jgi:hypothetical protein